MNQQIRKLQTCDTQQIQILNFITGKTIRDVDIPVAPVPLPTPLPSGTWFQATDPTTGISIGAQYMDNTDATYNYSIALIYKLGVPGTGCYQNPITSCDCIQIAKLTKSNTPASDNILPAGMITTAMNSLPIVVTIPPPSSKILENKGMLHMIKRCKLGVSKTTGKCLKVSRRKDRASEERNKEERRLKKLYAEAKMKSDKIREAREKAQKEREMKKLHAEAKINAGYTSSELLGLTPMSSSKESRLKNLLEVKRTGRGSI